MIAFGAYLDLLVIPPKGINHPKTEDAREKIF
jgi:hypothetical protein